MDNKFSIVVDPKVYLQVVYGPIVIRQGLSREGGFMVYYIDPKSKYLVSIGYMMPWDPEFQVSMGRAIGFLE